MIEGDLVENVHVGEVLRAWCKVHNFTRLKLAERLNLPKSNIDRMFSKPTIDTSKLVDLSYNLQYNFFAGIWGSRYFVDSKTKREYLTTPPENIHIGNKIAICLRDNNISQNQLAAHLGVQHPVVSKLLRKESIDSGRLVAISNFLKHDFFADYYMNVSRNDDMTMRFLPYYVAKSKETIEQNESYKAILNRNEELVAENARLKDCLKDVYSNMQKFKDAYGVSIENWDTLVKKEGVDIMNMATFFLMEAHIKKILDESEQTDSSKTEKD